jgi:hypothetical protein
MVTLIILVEAAGVEPASREQEPKASTSLAGVLRFSALTDSLLQDSVSAYPLSSFPPLGELGGAAG